MIESLEARRLFSGTFSGKGIVPVYDYFGALPADIDGRAGPDLLTGNGGIYMNDGTGQFRRSKHSLPGLLSYVSQPVAAADFNGDGFADVVRADRIYLSLGNGRMRLSYTIHKQGSDVPGYPRELASVAIGDVNHDRKPDIAYSINTGVHICINLGNGTFDELTYLAPRVNNKTLTGGALAIGDFNSDGWLDLVGGQYPTSTALFLNDKHGHFRRVLQVPETGNTIISQDLNRDRKNDLIIASFGSSYPQGTLLGAYFFAGGGDGTFAEPKLIPGTRDASGIVSGDFNGDRRLDLAVQSAESCVLRFGTGKGTFRAGESFSMRRKGIFYVGDLNGDRKTDLGTFANDPGWSGDWGSSGDWWNPEMRVLLT